MVDIAYKKIDINADEVEVNSEFNELYEAYLLYNGAPSSDDDPADYYEYKTIKAVRIA